MLFDWLGALASLTSTYYFIRLDNKAWPVGIIATLINGWLYWHKGIYAETVLEIFYFASMCYGWYRWREYSANKIKAEGEALGHFSSVQWSTLALIFCLVFASIYYALNTWTHSTVAFLDATTTSLSLLAQWLMCHRIIYTWCLWFIVDALYILMYFNKELPVHSALMFVYTGMAVVGYLAWVRKARSDVMMV